VDKYIVLSKIGEGGMGVVYAAYDPALDRKVALKVLAAPAGPPALLREAKAMARLSHPNVVTVYAAGMVDERVYLAMELVPGGTLREWLEQRKRTWREVVHVFRQAGAGLSAAHAAGVAHRDFKPDNVLVSEDGIARVTDFGVAAIRRIEAGEKPGSPGTVLTTLDGAGTPAYMSPEQRAGQPADARSDQYAFGVSLYEALHGSLPVADREARLPARLRAVLARARSEDPAARYPSMDALLAALAHDPAVRARRLLWGGAVLSILGVTLWWGTREGHPPCGGGSEPIARLWPTAARARAQQAFLASGATEAWGRFRSAIDGYADAWSRAHQEACEATRVRREQSESVMDLRLACLERLLDEARALVALYSHPTPGMLADAPLAPYRLRSVESCSASSVLGSRLAPPTPAEQQATAPMRAKLAEVLALFRAGRYAEGAQRAKEALERARAIGYQPLVAEALFLHGLFTGVLGDARRASVILREALQVAKASRHDVAEADAWIELVWVTGKDLAHYDDALAMGEMAEAAVRATADRGERRALAHHYIGEVLGAMGRHPEALERLRKALSLRERVLGSDHPDTAKTLHNIAGIQYQVGRTSEAEASFRAALARFEKALGPNHLLTGKAAGNLGEALRAAGKLEEAQVHLERGLRVESAALGPKALALAFVHHNLGELFRGRREHREALAHYRAALEIFEARRGPSHPDVAHPLQGIGDALVDQGRATEALPLLERSLSIRRAARTDPLRIADSELALSRALLRARPGGWRGRARKLVASAQEMLRRLPHADQAIVGKAEALKKALGGPRQRSSPKARIQR
jgi:tetratricopeptide (TPR) repeat protein